MAGKCFGFFLCFLLGGLTAFGGKYEKILGGKEKKIVYGYTYYNEYAHAAFVNPSLFSSKARKSSFAIMPMMTENDRPTYDDLEAKVRFFFKPGLMVRTVGRRSQAVNGTADWKIEKIADGVKYSRTFERGSCTLQAIINAKLLPGKAVMQIECSLKNTGERDCKLESSFGFAFLKNDVAPMNLTIQRESARFVHGVRTSFRINELTRMDGKTSSYWWRRVVKDQSVFSNYLDRERIPFNLPRVVAPEIIGVSDLIGKNTLVWDFRKTPKLSELDVSWEGECGYLVPVWSSTLKAGESFDINFRVLTVKGVSRFDMLTDNWVFGYQPDGTSLKVNALPLKPSGRIRANISVNDESGVPVVTYPGELPSMTPFLPAKLDLRSSVPFKLNGGYPVKIVLATLENNSRILEVDSTIVP